MTGTYSRDKITCSTHTWMSRKERKAGAISRAVHTQGRVKRNEKQGQNHVQYTHRDTLHTDMESTKFDWKSSVGLFRIAVNTVGGTNSGHKLDI